MCLLYFVDTEGRSEEARTQGLSENTLRFWSESNEIGS